VNEVKLALSEAVRIQNTYLLAAAWSEREAASTETEDGKGEADRADSRRKSMNDERKKGKGRATG
jgi:hypothetical protein